MQFFLGFLMGRALFGNRVGCGILLYFSVLPACIALAFALHITTFAAEATAGVWIAGAMLINSKRRFGTWLGILRFAFGALSLSVTWIGLTHLPAVPHHLPRTPNVTLAWAGYCIALIRPLAIWLTAAYAALALFYVYFLVTRQISMEYLFKEFLAWEAERHGRN